MTFRSCETCGDSMWMDKAGNWNHQCPPAWDVIDEDGGEVGVFYGSDAEDAAENCAEQVHSDWDSPKSMTLSVRARGSELWKKFRIDVDWNPVFHAYLID